MHSVEARKAGLRQRLGLDAPQQRPLGAEDAAERERRDCREQHPGGVGNRSRWSAETLERRVAAVAREEHARTDHDRRPTTGNPITQIPGRVRDADVVRQIGPQPVLELVDEREEPGRDQRGGNPDQRAQEDQL